MCSCVPTSTSTAAFFYLHVCACDLHQEATSIVAAPESVFGNYVRSLKLSHEICGASESYAK